MDGGSHNQFFALGEVEAGLLMPMHLCISATGHIRSIGPTLGKIIGQQPLIGRRFLEVFGLRRPRDVHSTNDVMRIAGQPLGLYLRDPPQTGFKGIAVPLNGQGLLLNLSFGIHAAEAVREYSLTQADFAPTELVIEMLFLTEAKTAVMDELRRLNTRLHDQKLLAEEQALTDAVTGLRNRRALERALDRLIEMGMPFGLLSMDLDHFKQVNDTLGHAAGDHVLETVAKILIEETRGSDVAARLGGDEFVILLPGLVDMAHFSLVAHRILARIEQPILFEGKRCLVSASIGTLLSPAGGMIAAEQLLAEADAALYTSKQQGRGRVTAFDPPVMRPPKD